ncbi:MAG: substrate-binding domain-containing protein [Propionibacteriaceae bacterium]|jgi:phosphate transport system substrate-binding protein|nr:substrate-binding domain-containing protein [Propionibacteriaceae bacterium]
MKRTLIALFALALAGCATSTSPSPTALDTSPSESIATNIDYPTFEPGAFRLDGSTAAIPLGSLILQRTMGVPATDADNITFSTTMASYLQLAWSADEDADETPMVLLAYEPDDSTRETLADYGDAAKMEFHPIGRDALVFLTNSANPVDSLTGAQIKDIYNGKITNWSEVGGEDKEIIAYQRPEDSGSGALMRKLVMGDAQMMSAPTDLISSGMEGLIEGVSTYQNSGNALGYSVYYYAHNMYALPDIKLLGVDGVAPENPTIASGAYPYVNDFYAVILASEPADSPARQLVEWLESPDGQALVDEAGYVPVK